MIPISRPVFGDQEQEAVQRVLASGMVAHGPETEAFEQEFAAYAGTRHAVAVNSGTAALHVALVAAGVKPGDEVVTSPFTFVATVNAILMAGASPVFADIDPETFNLDPVAARAACTNRTTAIMPVHLFGQAADLGAFRDLCDSKDLVLVEDAAQAHGARYKDRHVGGFGDAGAFSLYPTKNMTSGEGGMVTTDDDQLAEVARSFRNHGRGLSTLGTYDHVRFGYNYRLTDLGSAIGRVQLGRLDGWVEARRANAEALDEAFADVPGIVTPVEAEHCVHAYHQYSIRAGDRDRLQAALKERGVGSGIYYPKPAFEYPHLARFAKACPEAQEACRDVLSLPVHPGLSPEEVVTISQAVRDAVLAVA